MRSDAETAARKNQKCAGNCYKDAPSQGIKCSGLSASEGEAARTIMSLKIFKNRVLQGLTAECCGNYGVTREERGDGFSPEKGPPHLSQLH